MDRRKLIELFKFLVASHGLGDVLDNLSVAVDEMADDNEKSGNTLTAVWYREVALWLADRD